MSNLLFLEKRKFLQAHTNLSFINSLSTYNEFFSKKMFKHFFYKQKFAIFFKTVFLNTIKKEIHPILPFFIHKKFINISWFYEIFIEIYLINKKKFLKRLNQVVEKITETILKNIQFPLITKYNFKILKKNMNIQDLYQSYKKLYILKKYFNKKKNNHIKYFKYLFTLFGNLKKIPDKKKLKKLKIINNLDYKFRKRIIKSAIKLNIHTLLENEVYKTCKLQKERYFI